MPATEVTLSQTRSALAMVILVAVPVWREQRRALALSQTVAQPALPQTIAASPQPSLGARV